MQQQQSLKQHKARNDRVEKQFTVNFQLSCIMDILQWLAGKGDVQGDIGVVQVRFPISVRPSQWVRTKQVFLERFFPGTYNLLRRSSGNWAISFGLRWPQNKQTASMTMISMLMVSFPPPYSGTAVIDIRLQPPVR